MGEQKLGSVDREYSFWSVEVEVEVKEQEGTNFKFSGPARSAKYPHKTHLLFDRSTELTAEASTSTKENCPVLKKVYTVVAGGSL